jgi:hypothetical protein
MEWIMGEYSDRITPDEILSLKDNEIYVFPTTLCGKHSNIYSVLAQLRFGARYGKAFGIQGKTFAIPTIDKDMKERLPISRIKHFIDKFYDEAEAHHRIIYYVVGFGNGGIGSWPVRAIAPLFESLSKLDNVYLPIAIWRELAKREPTDP